MRHARVVRQNHSHGVRTIEMLNDALNDDAPMLDSAMQYFWTHGYQASDFGRLAAHLGTDTDTLRERFGSKHALFRAAIARYLAQGFDEEIKPFEAERSPLAAIRKVFDAVIAQCLAPGDTRSGVLFGNALEVAPFDPIYQQAVRGVLIRIEAYLYRCVERGQRRAEISKKTAPEDFAKLLLGALLGIRVLSRTRPNPAHLEAIARSSIAMLVDEPSQG
jgi:TetR/AcrR family transcriptional repressor of nem operon